MIHAPGIYFGMPEAEYHADESLSTSGIRKLLQDPEEYWFWSPMNPARPPEEDKENLFRGKLRHCLVLEPDVFDDKYVLAPHIRPGFYRADVEVLKTIDDMAAWLDRNRVPYKKSMNKAGFEAAVQHAYKLGIGDTEPYLADIEAAFFQERHKDKTVIWSREVWNETEAAVNVIREHPYFSKALAGGMSEVSIFWIDEESGVPMKARIDKLHATSIIDYKTLYVARNKSARRAALDAIKWEKYDLGVAVYTVGLATVINQLNAGSGVVSGEVSGKFMDRLLDKAEKPYGFVFQNEAAPYTVRGLKVVRRSGDLFNVFGEGLLSMNTGIQIFKRFKELYGEKRWFDPDGMTEIGDHEIYYAGA